jgi:hypothetical protein
MAGTQMKAKKGGAHSPTTGTKEPKSGRPATPTNMGTHGNEGAVKAPGDISNTVSKPANSSNLYQEGNMTTSPSDANHRPGSAVSNMLPGGTTQSGDTGGM